MALLVLIMTHLKYLEKTNLNQQELKKIVSQKNKESLAIINRYNKELVKKKAKKVEKNI